MAEQLTADEEERLVRTQTIKDEVAARAATVRTQLPVPSGFEDESTKRLIEAHRMLRESGLCSLKPLLPLLLNLKGKPYTLDNYLPFEPLFRTRMPRNTLLKTGRQVAKSTGLASQGITLSNSIPFFTTLYVTPLFEMIRRFSHQYVREFIERSPVRRLFTGSSTINSVLQRSFKNGSTMFFSYAFLDADRTRGLPADRVSIDEIQDMQHEFLQIIYETLSGSPWAIKQHAGTPKSLDNTIQALWEDSSQAEWMIKCHHGGCGHWNVPSLNWDLMDMIGPWHRDISEKEPGIVCAKCTKPLRPRTGRWVHAYPERRWSSVGYHIPQIIMPLHYANHEKWDILVGKSQGKENTTTTTFLNEVCGESCDAGSKLVTDTDLKNAAVLPWPNEWREATKHLKHYTHRILTVDWGGGGGRVSSGSPTKKNADKRLRTSYTSMAVLGHRPDGKIDVIWGFRSLRTHDYEWEAQVCIQAVQRFRCSHIVHDYGGAGAGREVIMRQAGFPLANLIPVKYHGAATHNIMEFVPATEDHPRDWYSVDKSRSLITTCQCLKYGLLRTFKYDYVSSSDAGLLRDFLSLIEEKVTSRIGTDMYYITSNPTKSDDFAQAVNIGCCALWHMNKSWPNIAEAAQFRIPAAALKSVHPRGQVDWDDIR